MEKNFIEIFIGQIKQNYFHTDVFFNNLINDINFKNNNLKNDEFIFKLVNNDVILSITSNEQHLYFKLLLQYFPHFFNVIITDKIITYFLNISKHDLIYNFITNIKMKHLNSSSFNLIFNNYGFNYPFISNNNIFLTSSLKKAIFEKCKNLNLFSFEKTQKKNYKTQLKKIYNIFSSDSSNVDNIIAKLNDIKIKYDHTEDNIIEDDNNNYDEHFRKI